MVGRYLRCRKLGDILFFYFSLLKRNHQNLVVQYLFLNLVNL
ncbi:hypothetical protein D1AOALGA4SA_8395 [Olavius algarvensis Delta 1 endosymbiont]|nr:hypothetical protein D1AOALGA4SA_8395 [Olavius algarvensis Delta 1 endosymbiont]